MPGPLRGVRRFRSCRRQRLRAPRRTLRARSDRVAVQAFPQRAPTTPSTVKSRSWSRKSHRCRGPACGSVSRLLARSLPSPDDNRVHEFRRRNAARAHYFGEQPHTLHALADSFASDDYPDHHARRASAKHRRFEVARTNGTSIGRRFRLTRALRHSAQPRRRKATTLAAFFPHLEQRVRSASSFDFAARRRV